MDTFNPELWGYKNVRAEPFGNGWIVVAKDLPVLIDENNTGDWFCPTPAFYEQDFIPVARALFG